jgi:hypothetical protein
MFESLGDTDLDCTMPMVGERKWIWVISEGELESEDRSPGVGVGKKSSVFPA